MIECLGPTNTRVYTVGVYFRGQRLAAARGHSIQEAEMNAAEKALSCAHGMYTYNKKKLYLVLTLRRNVKKNQDMARFYIISHTVKRGE